jgi:hypothetical protein
MKIVEIARLAADFIGWLFMLAGIMNLSGNKVVRAAYRFWHYRRGFHLIVDMLELLTALFLIVPQLRILGRSAGRRYRFLLHSDASQPSAIPLVLAGYTAIDGAGPDRDGVKEWSCRSWRTFLRSMASC